MDEETANRMAELERRVKHLGDQLAIHAGAMEKHAETVKAAVEGVQGSMESLHKRLGTIETRETRHD